VGVIFFLKKKKKTKKRKRERKKEKIFMKEVPSCRHPLACSPSFHHPQDAWPA